MKTTKYLRIAQLLGVLYLAGCSTTPPPDNSSTPAAAAPPVQSTGGKVSHLVSLTKNAPTMVGVGDQFTYELIATAESEVSDVTVADAVPEGATYIGSEPKAAVDGKKLTWRFENMRPGQSKNIRVTLKADTEGQLEHCATAYALPQICINTVVGRPKLAIRKTGPAVVQLGQEAAYTVVVENIGKIPARDVVVTDKLPEGLRGSGDQGELSFKVGDLAPGASKTISVPVKFNKRGKITNSAFAVASNAEKVSAEAPTTIMLVGVKIQKSTKDQEIFINRAAAYSIQVTNTGDSRLTGVVVTETAAAGTIIAAAEGATVSGTTATWNLAELNPGENKSFMVKIVSKVPGTFTDMASVATAEGLKDSSKASTTWKGVTGVLVELLDDPDPIQVGETTKHTIRVSNQGTAIDLSQVQIVSTLPPELELVPGTTSDGGAIQGRKITWPVIGTIPPKGSVVRSYIAKGVKAGDARTLVSVSDSTRKDGIEQRESTTVY